MRRKGEIYLGYLEALALSLIAELERRGVTEARGVDWQGTAVTYSLYNAKDCINTTRTEHNMSYLEPNQ